MTQVGWHGYDRDPKLLDADLQRARDAVEEEQWAQAHPALARLGITSRTGVDEALERIAGGGQGRGDLVRVHPDRWPSPTRYEVVIRLEDGGLKSFERRVVKDWPDG